MENRYNDDDGNGIDNDDDESTYWSLRLSTRAEHGGVKLQLHKF
jgi:hypothetical protein